MNKGISINWWSYTIPKSGNTECENEDAVYPSVGHGKEYFSENDKYSFIIADGATQTSFSGAWARFLVDECAKARLSEFNLMRAANNAQKTWKDYVNTLEIPWHAVEKFKQGAYAAINWVEIGYSPLQPANAFSWKVITVGDCCLFIARNDAIYLSFPIQEQNEFSNSPILLPSRINQLGDIQSNILYAGGTLKADDNLVLASDALAEWIIKNAKINSFSFRNMIVSIKSAGNIANFAKWIQSLRASGEIKNDDTSVILIEPGN